MSKFQSAAVACPACGASVEFDVVLSVNADRRPDLRDAILAGTFQSQECPDCRKPFRLDPEFTYLDIGRNLWILVQPVDRLERWDELEDQARESFAVAYGPDAPRFAQELGKSVKPRVTFGWAALREKLYAAEQKL